MKNGPPPGADQKPGSDQVRYHNEGTPKGQHSPPGIDQKPGQMQEVEKQDGKKASKFKIL